MLPYINYPFEYLSGFLGTSVDELKLIISFILSYPLAGLLKRIPDSRPAYKNAFIIGVSVFYLVGLFDLWAGFRTLLISSVGAYTMATYIRGPFMPWIAFVFLMGHLSLNHIRRQSENNPSVVDVTGAQMVLVMKLTAFCWNVHDGRLPQSTLTDFQKERALPRLPPLLDYFGYVFFFPSLFAGPAFDYSEYHHWISTAMFEVPAGTDPSHRPRTHASRRIPRSGTPALFKAMTGFFWIFAFLKFSGWYTRDLLLSHEYLRYALPHRVWLLHMFGFTTRLKYYGVWALTEGACILSGLGYKGIDPVTKRVRWNRLQNVAPWPLETAQNTRAYLENWNINTNHWLRNYVYLRVTPKGKKPGFRASMATFVTSAFWHGFYPGYYLTFVLAAFLQTVAKNFRRHIRPLFLPPSPPSHSTTSAPHPPSPTTPLKRTYDILSYLITQLAFSFAVAPFILLDLPSSLTVWRRVWFYCPVGVAVSMAFFASPAKAYVVNLARQREKQRGEVGTSPALREKSALAVGSAGRTPQYQQNAQGAKHRGSNAGAAARGKDTVLGLPSDPAAELQEILQDVSEEVRGGYKATRGGRAREEVESPIGRAL
ncbi:MAG: lysophospholipid acyltransferase [Caeruleum heppii]|nr:MAG: lysophospholipid acyltransferase [Caeruleum heppii]